MPFRYFRKSGRLRIAPKYSWNHIKPKPGQTLDDRLLILKDDPPRTDTIRGGKTDYFEREEWDTDDVKFYGTDEAIWAAEDILGEADLAKKQMIEMDKQILREILWHIDEGYGIGLGTLKKYRADKERAEEAKRQAEAEQQEEVKQQEKVGQQEKPVS